MVTDKLSIYNGALRELGETPLRTLTDNRPARLTLDKFYSDAINYCLEVGSWTFATRTIKLDYSTAIEPSFGKRRFFDKPTDYVNLVGIWLDEYMEIPAGFDYDEDARGWYLENEEIFVKYISNDTSFGLNLSSYSASYKLFVERRLAYLTAPEITRSRAKMGDLIKMLRDAERDARNVDARGKPPKRLPHQTWVKARHYGYANNRYSRY